MHIDVRGHGSQGDDGIQNIVQAAHNEGDVHGKQMMRESIEKADDDQNQGVRNHDGLVSDPVNDLSHQGRGQESADGRNGEKQADGHGIGTVEEHEHIGPEGEKHLFARSVEDLQHIILDILFPEIETALVFIRGAGAGNAQAGEKTQTDDGRTDRKDNPVEFRGCPDHQEGPDNDQVSGQGSDLLGSVLQPQRFSAPAFPGILKGQGIAHAQLHMVTQGVDKDAQDHEHTAGGHHRLGRHAGQHEQCAELVDALRGKHVQHSQNKDQQQARKFPEELGDAFVKPGHTHDFCQVIVDDPLVETVGKAEGDDREKK